MIVSHSSLVEAAAIWLRRTCSIVITELATTGEEPDAIGWSGTHSTLIECKTSRADFEADRAKYFRANDWCGIAQHRYFLSPPGVIPLERLPDRWGLLEITGARIRVLCKAEVFPEVNHRHEIRILLSALRRIGGSAPPGISIRCYTIETRNRASLGVEPSRQ